MHPFFYPRLPKRQLYEFDLIQLPPTVKLCTVCSSMCDGRKLFVFRAIKTIEPPVYDNKIIDFINFILRAGDFKGCDTQDIILLRQTIANLIITLIEENNPEALIVSGLVCTATLLDCCIQFFYCWSDCKRSKRHLGQRSPLSCYWRELYNAHQWRRRERHQKAVCE